MPNAMKHARTIAYTVAALVAGCAPVGKSLEPLAGVSGVQSVSGLAGMTRERVVPGVHRDRHPSHMAPRTQNEPLLYVSDAGTAAVYAFTLRAFQVGTLTGFGAPAGLCADAHGNVYVADEVGQKVFEYAHGGTRPIATLADSYGYPIGCSVDAKTGNLAVANFAETAGAGALLIYAPGSHMPTIYTDPNFYNYWPPGYDAGGNLFIEGRSTSDAAGLDELPRGGSALESISMKERIHFPAGVAWDGQYVAAGDQEYGSGAKSGVYRLRISGNKASFVSSLALTGSCGYNDVLQFWLVRNGGHAIQLIGPNLNCATSEFWAYPAGGADSRAFTGFNEPTGAALSEAH